MFTNYEMFSLFVDELTEELSQRNFELANNGYNRADGYLSHEPWARWVREFGGYAEVTLDMDNSEGSPHPCMFVVSMASPFINGRDVRKLPDTVTVSDLLGIFFEVGVLP